MGSEEALEVFRNRPLGEKAKMSPPSGLKPGECGKVCKELKGKSYCKELCVDVKSGAFVKVFVGVVLPKVAPSGVNAFELCQGEKCVKADQVSTFGIDSKHADKPSKTKIDKENYEVAEVDVTAVMEKQGWTLKNIETLTAKMTSTVMDKLPGPVVILKELEKRGKVVKGKVFRNPKEERSKYGDLLDEYSKGSSKKRVKKVKRV